MARLLRKNATVTSSEVVDLTVADDLTVTDDLTVSGDSTFTGDSTHNGKIIMATNKKIEQRGACLQSSTNQALTLGY